MNKIDTHRHFWNLQHALILLLLTFLCYWAFTFGIFSAKNDNIVAFLPLRFHISEALRNGHLPLWSPYIYLGYPVHGDVQSGAWNPAVWFLSVFGRYNITSLHVEILICIFLSGLSMYRLLGIKNFSSTSKLIGASAYLMCGFITDVAGSNLLFLWGAACAPFALAYYYEQLQNPSFKNALKTSVALSLFFVTAYPSFFILTSYILLAAFLLVSIKYIWRKNHSSFKTLLISNLFLVLIFTGLSAVAIVSYMDILPFYERSKGIDLKRALEDNFHPLYSVSFILPTVAAKIQAGTTDLISRNAYFNIFILLFFIHYIRKKRTFLTNCILAGILFFYLFSLGDVLPIRATSYKIVPLMNTFRHPANARLFVIIGSIFLGISGLENFRHKNLQSRFLKTSALLLLPIIAGTIIFFSLSIHLSSKVYQLVYSHDSDRVALKNFLDKLSVYDFILINGSIQIGFLFLFLWALVKQKLNTSVSVVLLLFNSFIFAQLNIPFTLASKVSPKEINSIVQSFPPDYPFPDQNVSIRAASADALSDFEKIGISGFYNKKINFTDVVFTPTFMIPFQRILSDSFTKKIVLSNSYAYIADTVVQNSVSDSSRVLISQGPIILKSKKAAVQFQLQKIWNNGFKFHISAQDSAAFCLEQLYLPGWSCAIDGKKVNIAIANGAFMAIQVFKGNHTVCFVYKPIRVIVGFITSIFCLIAVIFFFINVSRKPNA